MKTRLQYIVIIPFLLLIGCTNQPVKTHNFTNQVVITTAMLKSAALIVLDLSNMRMITLGETLDYRRRLQSIKKKLDHIRFLIIGGDLVTVQGRMDLLNVLLLNLNREILTKVNYGLQANHQF